MDLDRFSRVLQAIDADTSPRGIAEVLWLATHLDSPQEQTDHTAPEARRPALERPEATSGPMDVVVHGDWQPAELEANPTAADRRPMPVGTSAWAAPTTTTPGRSVSVSDSRKQQLAAVRKSLKALRRHMASNHRLELDEQATIDRICGADLWMPAMRPARRRWLELTLIVDGENSFDLWGELASDLRRTFVQCGAFRDVRLRHVWLDANDQVALTGEGSDTRGRPRSTGELIDPTGHRLTVVLSDCVGPLWQGPLLKALTQWAAAGPCVIVQPLTERMWPRTDANIVLGSLRAPHAGAPNRSLDFTADRPRSPRRPSAIPIPVLGIGSAWFTPWAKLVAGTADGPIDAAVIMATSKNAATRTPSPEPARSPQERIHRFLASSSPTAYRLLRHVSAAPVSVESIRLIADRIVADAQESHIVEVLYSGLVGSTHARHGLEQKVWPLDFAAGVRDVLIGTLRPQEAEHVVQEMNSLAQNLYAREVALHAQPLADDDLHTLHAATVGAVDRVYDQVKQRLYDVTGDTAEPTPTPPRHAPSPPATSTAGLHTTISIDPDGLDPALRSALTHLARVPQLLVASDYDGTIAPIVANPAAAMPLPEALAVLRSLATLPQTTVAVISSRALRDLAATSRLPSEVHLVGSHGSEFDIGFVQRLAPELVELRSRLQTELERIAAEHPGVRLENKPASVAVHLRTASRAVAEAVTDAIRRGPATWPGLHTTEGKEVFELSVLASHKGTAIDEFRRQVSAGAVLFMGDDVTDENAFRQLSGKDLGVKVGPGDTAAAYRVQDQQQAIRALGLLLDARRHWLFGERAVPIERHSMLADGRTVALISPDARMSWLCHPRPDSAAVFADLLGGTSAGYFDVSPQNGRPPRGQRYRPGTMTVETHWPGLSVTDWLEGDSLMRRLSGDTVVRIEFAPRPEFGQVPVQLQPLKDGLLLFGTSEHLCLYSPGVEWDVVDDGGHDTARAVIDLSRMNGEALLEMRMRSHDLTPHPRGITGRLEAVEQPWREWAAILELPTGSHRESVLRSALTLRGLCHVDSGGAIAAASTSLPQTLGGIRNWDYRFCRLRDGAMTVKALVDLGSLAEAEAFLRWVDGVVDRTGGHPERLHPLYTVDGYELGPEAVIESLPGYAGSRPVRIGKTSNSSKDLSIFGPVADVVSAVADRRGSIRHEEWRVMEAMVQAVSQRWHEPDHGIWEARLPPRHHVYSKVMCWMTVDRGLRVLERHTDEQRPDWVELRDRIAENVLLQGWHEGAKAYTVAYGFPEMDASSLWIGLSGLLADDDPRFLDTVLAVEAELRSGPVVYRYKWDDGMPGKEGGFHICTTWLIEAYLRTGRRADAHELFDQMLATAGPTGLLPEQYDPDLERGLGNHPFAMSHVGLVTCARLLSS